MKSVLIGKSENGKTYLDLKALIKGKLLAAASSGGGKSNLIRVLCERVYAQVPIIIIDREGEFGSLRKECPDFLLLGKGSDMPIHSGMAKILALRLWENRCSAIIDVSEMDSQEMHRFVAIFIQSLVDADKKIWAPLILLIDEAHEFCPENGEGSSMAKNPILQLQSKGRKRFIGVYLATQRVAKLDKSAISECRNLMVGFLNRHDDRASIGKELGFSTKDELFSIKTLNEGQFWMLGSAVSKEVIKVQVDLAKTNPSDTNSFKKFKAPAPSAKVKSLLDKLKDLPQEALEEAKTVSELRAQVKDLMAKLKKVPLPPPIISKDSSQEIEEYKKQLEKQTEKVVKEMDARRLSIIAIAFKEMRIGINSAIENVLSKQKEIKLEPYKIGDIKMNSPITMTINKPIKRETVEAFKEVAHQIKYNLENVKFGACEKAIVGFLNFKPERTWTKIQVAVGTGYSVNSGGFNNALGKLRSTGAIVGSGDKLQIADASVCPGKEPAENPLEAWKHNLGKCERSVWDVLMQFPSEYFTKEALGEKTGYSANSGGFNNALGRLNSLGLIERNNGSIRLNSEITF